MLDLSRAYGRGHCANAGGLCTELPPHRAGRIMPNTGQALYQHARSRIPGGTQLLSKRPEMLLPEQWPSYYSRASGSKIWDLDGKRYIDMSYSGIGSCILGYADA